MAYTHPGLQRIGPAHSDYPVLWAYYHATDAQADVNTEGYFNDASDDVNVGDVIMAHLGGSGAVVLFNVLSNAAGVVDVADGLALGVTDTD
jgi:hypothetical protein